MNEFWVFGYGSLMWNPGFEIVKQMPARLSGYRRSLCIYSQVYRGTMEAPGLVLGLDRGGNCDGIAFAVDERKEEQVMKYLRDRELITNVYRELVLPVKLGNETVVPAVCYVADPHHSQYTGKLTLQQQAAIINKAQGRAGTNKDYVLNTINHLRQMRIEDGELNLVASLLEDAGSRSQNPTARR